VQLQWGPASSPFAQRVVTELKRTNPELRESSVTTEQDLFRNTYRNLGRFDTSVWFRDAHSEATLTSPELEAALTGRKYTLWVNQTAAELYSRVGDYFHYAKVQSAVENAILAADYGSESGVEVLLEKLPIADPGSPTDRETTWNHKGNPTFAYLLAFARDCR